MKDGKYEGFLETSLEIIMAIEEKYEGKIVDETSEAFSQWKDPENFQSIITRAWEIANAEKNKLFWGMTKICR